MTTTNNNPDLRTEYTAGLRMLADLLDAHPELGLPFDGRLMPISVLVTREEGQKEKLAAWAKALPGKKDKSSTGTDDQLFTLETNLRGCKLRVIADRDEVCERIPTGETVTKKVKDPAVLAAVPEIEVVEEVYEWKCRPILNEEPPAVSS